MDDVRFCFTVFEDNEQSEEGDTLEHTWSKPDWPVCTTKHFYFWGDSSPSTSPYFHYHNIYSAPPDPPYPYEGTRKPHEYMTILPDGEMYLAWSSGEAGGTGWINGEVYKSSDYGDSWVHFTDESEITPGASPVMVTPYSNGYIMSARNMWVYKSPDGSPASWTPWYLSYMSYPFIAPRPGTPSMAAMAWDPGGTRAYHDYATLDGGTTLTRWHRSSYVEELVFAIFEPVTGKPGVNVQDYGSRTYHKVDPWDGSQYGWNQKTPSIIQLGLTCGVHFGTGKIAWLKTEAPWNLHYVTAWGVVHTEKALPVEMGGDVSGHHKIVIDPTIHTHLLAIVDTGVEGERGLWRTLDMGDNWTRIDDLWLPRKFAENAPGLAFDPYTPGYVYAWSNKGFFRSVDYGLTWKAKSQGIT